MQTTEQRAQDVLAMLEHRPALQLPTDKDQALAVLGREVQRLNGVLETTHERFFDLYKALLNKNKEIAALKAELQQATANTQRLDKHYTEQLQTLQKELTDASEALRREKALNADMQTEHARSKEDKENALRFASQHKKDTQDMQTRLEVLKTEFAQLVKARDEAQGHLSDRTREIEALRTSMRQQQDEGDRKRRELQQDSIEVQADLASKTELVELLRTQLKQAQSDQERQRVLMLQKDEQVNTLMGELTTLVANQRHQQERPTAIVATTRSDKSVDAEALGAQRALMASLKDAEVLSERMRLEGLVKDQEYLKLKAMLLESEEQKVLYFKQLEESREDANRLRDEDNKWLDRLEQLRNTYEHSIDKLCKEVHHLSQERMKGLEREGLLRREVSELAVKLELQKERRDRPNLESVLPPMAGILKLRGLSESKLLADSPVGQRPAHDADDQFSVSDHRRPFQSSHLKYPHVTNKGSEHVPELGNSKEMGLRSVPKDSAGKDDTKWDDLMSRIRLVGSVPHTS